MKIIKPELIATILLFIGLTTEAQVKIPVTNNDLRTNLSKILTDYAHGFTALKGDTIDVGPQTVEYTSRLEFNGAEQNSIVEYRAKNPVYSWKAVLMTTEDFEEASRKYKWLYNQLKVITVKVEDFSFTLSGAYEAPDESRKFSSSLFKLTPNAANMPRLKIEASMQYEFPEWKITLMVYEKEREDNERGDINDYGN
jgi:hypothetical protein